MRCDVAERGIDTALERKLPERTDERRLDGAGAARLLALACSQPPARIHRLLRLLAAEVVRLEAELEALGGTVARRLVTPQQLRTVPSRKTAVSCGSRHTRTTVEATQA